jgi:hypothetical protein
MSLYTGDLEGELLYYNHTNVMFIIFHVILQGTVLTYGFTKPDRVNDFTIDQRT